MADPTAVLDIGTLLGTGGGGIGSGVLLKWVWDTYVKPKKESYVTKEECKHTMESCPHVAKLDKQFIEHKTSVLSTLRQHSAQITEIKIDTSYIKDSIAKIAQSVAVLVERTK